MVLKLPCSLFELHAKHCKFLKVSQLTEKNTQQQYSQFFIAVNNNYAKFLTL